MDLSSFIDELKKIAVSSKWIHDRVRPAASKATPERVEHFIDNVERIRMGAEARAASVPKYLGGYFRTDPTRYNTLKDIADHAGFAADTANSAKFAATRGVREWRAASGAGDPATADAIARGHAQLGAKPRYLEDISLGGAEAGVDKMMGSAAAPAPAGPNLQQRLEQYKANKAQLGVEGRLPTTSVKASPEGRAALLRGTQAPAQAPAPNESGLIARKLYKPDSDISRGEFTGQLLEQKQRITDEARALSPEAKNMVPAMYGHSTRGQGALQRHTSTHEFVPGLSDLRGNNISGDPSKTVWSRGQQFRGDLKNVQDTVLNPMAAKGKTMADTISTTGTNYGNVVNSPQGPKVLDFLPNIRGEKNPATESFRTYAPEGSRFVEGGAGGNMKALRKEVFNPQMQIQPASGPAQMRAAAILRGESPPPLASSAASSQSVSTSGVRPTVAPGSAVAPAATAAPGKLRAAPAPTPAPATMRVAPAQAGLASHAPTMPATSSAVRGPTFRPPPVAGAASHMPSIPSLKTVGKLESAAATRAPGLLRQAAGTLSRIH